MFYPQRSLAATLRPGVRSRCLASLVCAAWMWCAGAAAPAFHAWAERPPMGWNSWDCFATTVTETQTKAHADIMAEKLARHGWEYVVVDIQWYEPGATGYDYRSGAPVVLDDHGRLLPAVNKFPSAAGGAGFKPLADYVHAKGLKFGVHLMRGIPRQAVEQNLPILGTPYRAADIADKVNICPWNADMYGVDMAKPGAQEYYDSVFALLASWDVDFVKVDDLSRPYVRNQPEVEAVRRAIDRTGRPMVLSLSPGETDLAGGAHVLQHANMWRISDDFWDKWPELRAQFKRLHDWTPHRVAGAWPDADMIPFGVIEMGRPTRFTREEHFTLMSLWCIARSPLMHGGDMTKMDDFTLSLLTNDEVIAVNQHSANNRQLFRTADDRIAWVADVPGSADKYVALFNARDRYDLTPARAAWTSATVTRATPGRAVPVDVDVRGARRLVLVADGAGDGTAWDHAVWVEPRLVLADGTERRLTTLTWENATAGHGNVSTRVAPSGQPMMVDGQPVAEGIGAHADSVISYVLPEGAVRLVARAAMDDAAVQQTRGGTIRFRVHTFGGAGPNSTADATESQPGLSVSVALADLGFPGGAQVRDLWARQDLGVVQGEFAPVIPWHGAGLYRVSPLAGAAGRAP